MRKRFNTTGVCVRRKHYMVDISEKIAEIRKLIESECYFTISKPRQYGKTTTLNELKKSLREEYLVISISFEGIGDRIFQDEKEFSQRFIELMAMSIELIDEDESKRMLSMKNKIEGIMDLSKAITKFIKLSSKEVVLFIDEVDKSSNNQLFLSFIGMLRNKYLAREMEEDITFKSVILVGMHDIKNLKLKIRNEAEEKYNSPWNIAVDFNIDMSFLPKEIATMLKEYSADNNLNMNVESLSKEIYFFTSGYPFLVSRICQIIDEKFYQKRNKSWEEADVRRAVKYINDEKNTLFESIVKNLENYNELYELVKSILVDEEQILFNPLDPIISLGLTCGILKKGNCGIEISNKIFKGYLLTFNFNKNKEYKEEKIEKQEKEIFQVFV